MNPPPPPASSSVPTFLERVLRLLACLMLLLGAFACVGSLLFSQLEDQWHPVVGVVQQDGQEEICFTAYEDGASHSVFVAPPQGAPAWRTGQRVELVYPIGRPQFARLRSEQRPPCSGWLSWGAPVLFLLAVPCLFMLHHVRQARLAAAPCPAPLRPRSFTEGVTYVFAWLLGLVAFFCACLMGLMLLLVVGGILYEPDPPAFVMMGGAGAAFYAVVSASVALVARMLFARDRLRRELLRGE